MSLQIVKPRTYVERIEKRRSFEWADCPGAGFSFNLTDDGEIVVTDGNRENVELCLAGEGVSDLGIEEIDMSYTEPAVGKCSCGREVQLESVWTNHCRCGRSYNSFGQLLASPSQWGEETGETYSDIVRGGEDF